MKNILTFTLALLCCFVAHAQPGSINSHFENSQVVRDLSGYKWKMKMMLPGQGVKEGLHELPPVDIETLVWNPAKVPGDVYTDLWKVGAIDDPYFGRNSVRAQWVQQYEWWYSHQFNVTQDITGQVVRLEFEGVDYSCEVWLNGHYLGRHEGAFSSFAFDVTDELRVSKKNLESTNMLMIKLDPPPQVNAKVAGKKTPWFGDYWRDLIPFGIIRPVKLVASGKVRIDDVYANSTIKKNNASVDVEVTLENTTSSPKTMSVTTSIDGYNFEAKQLMREITKVIAPGKHKVIVPFEVKDAKLWWPWDLGKPNLYHAKVTIKEGKTNHDTRDFNFGIREVTMEWNPGFTKDEVSFPRTTMINGKNHFIRSACWGGPPDIFVGRTSNKEYATLIRLAKEANMNNIRIFGWHPPEIPEFYRLCDEAGITVWQDMIPLGTGNIPQDREKINGIMAEAASVIKERRNHPSLVMMEGGEEMLLRTSDAHFGRSFLEELGDTLQSYVKLPYVPDSPLTCHVSQEAGFKKKEAVHALRYFYGMGHALAEDWYQTLDFPIVPEFAITSVPNVESLKKFIPENEMWPPGLSWGHHWADLQRLKMQNWDIFGDEKIGSLEEFVAATQIAQGVIFQNGIEYFRRQKPRLSGIALCHFITYWPDMKWAIVDNYQEPKRSFDYVTRAYQPLLASLHFKKRRWHKDEPFKGELWVINDLYEKYNNCTMTMVIEDDNGKKLSKESYRITKIDENSAKMFYAVEEKVLKKVDKQFTVKLELKDAKGNQLSSNEYFFLIGDQKTATAQFKEQLKEMRERNGKYSYGNYFRFFEELIEENDKKYDTQEQTPRAIGY